MRTGKIASTANVIALSTNRELVISQTEPATNKRYWLEVDSSGVPLHNWIWGWDGTYWRGANEPIRLAAGALVASYGGPIPIDTHLSGVLVKDFRLVTYCPTAQDASNHWQILIDIRSAANDTSTLIDTTTAANAVGVWELQAIPLNQVLLSAATRIAYFQAIPINSPGALFFGGVLNSALLR